MSDQGPTADATPTPPHGTPATDGGGDPTMATPSPGAADTGGASVFGDVPSAGGDPTVVIPPVTVPGQGTPPPVGGAGAGGAGSAGGGGGPAGPGGPGEDGEPEEDEPWYTHPAAITAAALLGIIALIVILVLALGGDDDPPDSTTTSSTTTSTTTTSTTAPTTENRCIGGDQSACQEFSDDQLQVLCDDGATAACQVLLARQGDGVPDQTTTVAPAPSDADLCRQSDAGACSRLSDSDVSEICGEGVQTACDEQNARFDDSDYEAFREECRNGNDAGCQNLTNDDLVNLCSEGFGAACAEIDSRTGE